jgi:hypothetical protein
VDQVFASGFFAMWFSLGMGATGICAYYAATGKQVRGWPRTRGTGKPLGRRVAWLLAANYLLVAVAGLLFFPWH